jgi:hypothetical protein
MFYGVNYSRWRVSIRKIESEAIVFLDPEHTTDIKALALIYNALFQYKKLCKELQMTAIF